MNEDILGINKTEFCSIVTNLAVEFLEITIFTNKRPFQQINFFFESPLVTKVLFMSGWRKGIQLECNPCNQQTKWVE